MEIYPSHPSSTHFNLLQPTSIHYSKKISLPSNFNPLKLASINVGKRNFRTIFSGNFFSQIFLNFFLKNMFLEFFSQFLKIFSAEIFFPKNIFFGNFFSNNFSQFFSKLLFQKMFFSEKLVFEHFVYKSLFHNFFSEKTIF